MAFAKGKFAVTHVADAMWDEGLREYQRPEIHHRVIEYSDDYTVIEITSPADFETVTVAP